VFGLIEKRNTGIDVRGIEKSAKVPFPTPTTYDAIARYRMEISGPVSRQFLTSLAEFAPSTEAKAEINKLGKSKDYFHQKVAERRLNLAQTLEIICGSTPWSAVPFSILIEGLLSLQPRPYSISSSPRVQKDKLTITATVESVPIQDTALTFNGVTSNYLFALQQKQNKDADSNPYGLTYSIEGPRNRYEGIQIPVFIRPSNFRLPSNPATTVIMVGPGSGVAPFRGFIQERAAQKKAGEKVGKTILFYGCRTPGDFIYQEDWKV
jgi:NADPH-ferrihemoprotein reductase